MLTVFEGFFYALTYDMAAAFPTLFLLRRLSLYCLTTRDMAAVLFSAYNVKQYNDMSNKKNRADRRNVSVEKLQTLLSNFLADIAEGAESLPVRKSQKGLVIYIENHGVLNFTLNEKGGKE